MQDQGTHQLIAVEGVSRRVVPAAVTRVGGVTVHDPDTLDWNSILVPTGAPPLGHASYLYTKQLYQDAFGGAATTLGTRTGWSRLDTIGEYWQTNGVDSIVPIAPGASSRTNVYQNTAYTPGSADYAVEILSLPTLVSNLGRNPGNIVLRQADVSNMYMLAYAATASNNLVLRKIVAGSPTTLAQTTAAVQERTTRLEIISAVNTNVLRAYWNGESTFLAAADNSLAAAGRAGLRPYQDANANGNPYAKLFRCYEYEAPGAGAATHSYGFVT